jgi:alkanesulfonate monooxygenase SsuD/methylene tetrahydromethanopterin reductase-like flavin-dependent oxidoreductase (luciferase family)
LSKPLHLAWFLGNTFGVHDWAGPWSGNGAREWARPDFQVDIARALERAGFDYLLMEDSSFVPDNYGGSTDFYLQNAARVPKNDPVPLIPILARATKHLGIVCSIATTYYPPYITARPGPQHHPVLTQAGDSAPGRDLAARHADSVLTAFHTVEQMKAYRADLRERLRAAGRDPDSCKILFVVSPTLGDTRAEAVARAAAKRAWVIENPEIGLAMIGSLVEIDFSGFSLDAPLEELTTNGQQGILARFAGSGDTLREVVANWTYGYEDLVGTPDDVAGQLDEIMTEVGGDGVLFCPPTVMNRKYLAEVTDGLVPALRRRGLARTEYTADTLRGNLQAF